MGQDGSFVTKNQQITKVVVGLNYTIDSLVTLFLLKKQDYDITAVAIDFAGDEGEEIIRPHCHASNLKKIKEVCDRFDVPLFATDVRSLYQSDLKNKFLQMRSIGQSYNPCHFCGHIILYTLFQKMLKLNADFIATGHFARIARKNKGNKVSILHSMNLEDDQSHRIIGVKQEVLRKLILPLGDLTKEEVTKIFHRIYPENLDIKESKTKPCEIFKDIEKYGHENLPKEFCKEGDLMLDKEQIMVGSHRGFFNYEVGKPLSKEDVSFFFSDRKKQDLLQVKGFKYDENRVLVEYDEKNYCQFLIQMTKASGDFDRATPLSVLVRFGSEKELLPGTLFFKGHHFMILAMEKPRSVVGDNEIVTFFSAFGIQKKVLGQGLVTRSIQLDLENVDIESINLKLKMSDTFYF